MTETNPRFPRTFFEGLRTSDDEAVRILSEAAFPGGTPKLVRTTAECKRLKKNSIREASSNKD